MLSFSATITGRVFNDTNADGLFDASDAGIPGFRAFLDATPLPELQGKATFREACLKELRAARKAGLLGESNRFAGSCGETKVGKRNAEGVHLEL